MLIRTVNTLENMLALLLLQVMTAYGSNPLQYGGKDGGKYGGHLVVVDTDAGSDDAMAISLLLGGTRESNWKIAGITCVRGNTGVHNVSKNVLRTLYVNGRLEIPVYEGSDYGLISTSPTDYYFGEDGFGDFNYPVPNVSVSRTPAAVFLADIVRNNPGEVTILALGPLTNLAVAGLLYPDFYKNSKEIIFLGGSTSGIGNMNGTEFNVWVDPAAAKAVFSRSPPSHPITIVPSETIRHLVFPWAWRKYIMGMKGTAVMEFLNSAEREERESAEGWEVEDPAAAAVVVDPSVVVTSFLGRAHLTPSGRMTVSGDGRELRVVSEINKERLMMMLMTLL